MKNNILREIEKWVILVLIAVVAYWAVNNIDVIWNLLKSVYKVFFPFILGGLLAVILNVPMISIEKKLSLLLKDKIKPRYIRIIAIVLSLMLLLLIVVAVAFLLIPELISNIELLIKNIPGLIDKAEVWLIEVLQRFPGVQTQIKDLFLMADTTGNLISNALNYFVNGAIGFVSDLISGFITTLTAIIFSIYMLSQKEYLISGSKKILYAIFSKEKADSIIKVGSLVNSTFSKFISGQCVEAVILGTIMFAILLLGKFPYALIISVLTSITALIPIFGAIIAMIVGAILIAITNPIKALFFICIFLVIQQIEGNFIYPKVVGKSVGLSPMWTLLSITVFGNLFGVVGMLLGLPVASVLYAILTTKINERLNQKKIAIK